MTTSSQSAFILFPRPFAFTIDDLGWMSGQNSVQLGQPGPYRLGINRNMSVCDYQVVVDIAKEVGVRVQGLFILAELDMNNVLANSPNTTWMGKDWDNSQHISSGRIEPIIDFVIKNPAYLEFGLHGLAHEYWKNGVMKRAEWYCITDEHPWPEKAMRNHIEAVRDILTQHDLDRHHGHSFPESFAPSAYSFHWNPAGSFSTGSLLKEQGARYANALFDYIPELDSPKGGSNGGFDHGMLAVNRINYGCPWDSLNSLPTIPLKQQKSDIIESHWPNWLAEDGMEQEDVNKRWIDYYRDVQASTERYLAKNSEQFYSQWLYKRYTTVEQTRPGKVVIDNRFMCDDAYSSGILANMVLKVRLPAGRHAASVFLNGEPIACIFEEAGYTFFYLPKLERKIYELIYTIGDELMKPCIFNDGTYNVYSFNKTDNKIEAAIRLYGTQTVTIMGLTRVSSITLSNSKVRVLDTDFDESSKTLRLTLRAHDYQGETTQLILRE